MIAAILLWLSLGWRLSGPIIWRNKKGSTTMFKAGKRYEIIMKEAGENVAKKRIVESFEHPIVKFKDRQIPVKDGAEKTERGEIVNITSPDFVSARELDVKS